MAYQFTFHQMRSASFALHMDMIGQNYSDYKEKYHITFLGNNIRAASDLFSLSLVYKMLENQFPRAQSNILKNLVLNWEFCPSMEKVSLMLRQTFQKSDQQSKTPKLQFTRQKQKQKQNYCHLRETGTCKQQQKTTDQLSKDLL